MKLEICIAQPSGNHAAALQNKLGFRSQKNCANREHPLRRRYSDIAGTPSPPQTAHEFTIRQRTRRSDIYCALEIFPLDQELYGANEIDIMNPRHILPSRPGPAAEAPSHQPQQRIESASRIRAHDNRASQSEFARLRSLRGEKSALPIF